LAFALSRYLGREFVSTLLSDSSRHKLRKWSRTDSATTLLIVRFIPVIAFNLINYAAGLAHITWWTFLWTTGIGILPLTILFVYLGESMRGSTLSDWLLFVVGAGAVILIFRLLRNWTERRLGLSEQRRDQK
ncbi:MAG: TVP38/TMEM64 family protein, partial [Desulfobulbia bacterium]